MKRGLQLRGGQFEEFADFCYEKISHASSKIEALGVVAEIASSRIDDYARQALEEPDEVSMLFVELLDQIIFELTENMPADAMVRDYLAEDLFARLAIYLDIFRGREIYAASLKKRLLTYDDTVIMRRFGMKEHASLLMSEYYEQPVLQRPILLTLTTFDNEELLNFFYNIAKETGNVEIKTLAIAGLKRCGSRFSSWRQLATDNEQINQMLAYAQRFYCPVIEKNDIPRDLYSSIFVLQYVESNRDLLMRPRSFSWVMDLVRSMLDIGYFNSYLTDFYLSICNIIIFAGTDILKELLAVDGQVKTLVQVIDFLPREYFDRIMPKLSLLGSDFIHRINFMLSAGKMKLDNRESNTYSYFLWKTGNSL
jgi:hypothetical protein